MKTQKRILLTFFSSLCISSLAFSQKHDSSSGDSATSRKTPNFKSSKEIEADVELRRLDGSAARLAWAFRNAEGDWILQLKYDSNSRVGIETLFWGPKDEDRLYQMESRFPDATKELRTIPFVLSSSSSGSHRMGELVWENLGTLRVQAGSSSVHFRKPAPSELQSLETRIRSGELELRALPEDRQIEYFFKIRGTESYILIDAPRHPYSYDFRAFRGEKERWQSLPILRVIRLRNGGATYVFLADSSIVYSPSYFGKESPQLRSSPDGIDGPQLEAQNRELANLQSLGIDVSPYKDRELKTPQVLLRRCSSLRFF